jgi:hypothetical protein
MAVTGTAKAAIAQANKRNFILLSPGGKEHAEPGGAAHRRPGSTNYLLYRPEKSAFPTKSAKPVQSRQSAGSA